MLRAYVDAVVVVGVEELRGVVERVVKEVREGGGKVDLGGVTKRVVEQVQGGAKEGEEGRVVERGTVVQVVKEALGMEGGKGSK